MNATPTDFPVSKKDLADIPATKKGLYLVMVDGSHEFTYALKTAVALAVQNNTHVALLTVLEKPEFQPWANIEDRVKYELREQAERRLHEIAVHLNEFEGQMPAFYIEEGSPREVLVRVLKEDHDIKMLVLGDAKGSANPLVHYFVDSGVHEANIPLLVVPDIPMDKG